jgi:preprotein translocase subunit YajC
MSTQPIRFNYANDEHFASVLKSYGGEDALKKEFPRIYRLICDTREWHRSLEKEKPSAGEDIGFQDGCGLFLTSTMEKSNAPGITLSGGAYSCSSMAMTEKQSFVSMTGTVKNKQNRLFGGFSVYGENTAEMRELLNIDPSILQYSPLIDFVSETRYQAVVKNEKGNFVFATDILKQIELDFEPGTQIVKQITVADPHAKDQATPFVRIVYNGRVDADAVYNYAEAKDYYINGIRYVDTYVPVKANIELDAAYKIDEPASIALDETLLAALYSSVVNGEVHLNTAAWPEIKTKVSADKHSVEVTFPLSWKALMQLAAAQAEGIFDLHVNFAILCKNTGSGFSEKIPVIISTENLPDSPNLSKIKQLKILWGCLGKNTRIGTEQGNKIISEIKTGDKVLTANGTYVTVKNIVTGTEKKIIAVAVSEKETLLITAKHPIATERGIIQAVDLSAADSLKTSDGSFKPVYYLDEIDYNDKVYSLELESPALILANDIFVGDYKTSADPVKAKPDPDPLPPDLRTELQQWAKRQNEKFKKEIAA